jgi:DNA-binding MarR family transcriptional regulator
VGLFLTAGGRELLGSVRSQRTIWLTGRLEQLTRQDRELIRASLLALDQLSTFDQ